MSVRKNILITGASSGLGEGMARLFAAQGRNLALCARRTDRLEALRDELLAAYPDITIALSSLDVTDYDQVFAVFKSFRDELGRLDRIIVNAGLGKGQPLGTGYFYANRQTAETNFIGALAQCEAAMEIFREQNDGHLVMVSSMSAVRGMPRNLTTYAATKAGVAALSEGLRVEMSGTPIRVTTLFPGFIRSEMNARMKKTYFMVDTETGCRKLVAAMEKEVAAARIPWWPWALWGLVMKYAPASLVKRFG